MYLATGFLFAGTLAAKHETGFLNRAVTVGGETYHYQVYVPPQWDNKHSWPVILFLHGAGERGDDGLTPTQVGLGGGIRTHLERWPAIVVMPQCRKDTWWSADPKMEAQAMAALERSIKEFHGDPNRVYLTGLSMGGYGSWAFASKRPGKFAAMVVVCGGVRVPPSVRGLRPDISESADPYGDVAKKIGKTPVWIFHGDADRAVSVVESQKMNEALKAAGGDVRYTEYAGVDHNSWDKAYDDPELPKWLFAQSLKK